MSRCGCGRGREPGCLVVRWVRRALWAMQGVKRRFGRRRDRADRPEAQPGPDRIEGGGPAVPPPKPIRWETPVPPHVRERLAPLRGEDCATVRPYVLAETTLQLPVVRERLRAAALAALEAEAEG